jgi:phosphatidylglycerophosphatase A
MVLLMQAAGALGGGILILCFLGLSIWAGGTAERLLGRRDPPEVVSDEVAGFMVTLYLLPFSWVYIAGGFVLFRIMDIAKPFPIRRIEGIPGGIGIVLDDVLAGIFANLLLRGAGILMGSL